MKVIIIGPSIDRTKGGMATVIRDMLAASGPEVQFRHIVSHVEGGAGEKVRVTLKAMAALLGEKKADLVHIHVASDASFYRKSFFVILSRLMGKPVVMHVHGADFDSFYRKALGAARWYIRKIFSWCSRVLVLSGYWKEFFMRHIRRSGVEVLHNGVYVHRFADCYTMPANLNRFLFLGRLGQRKGVYDLLEAIDLLVRKEGRSQLVFLLAGDGDLEQVAAIIRQKGLEQQVQVLGWVGDNEKNRWLREADTMVLPSYNEGLPMSILEAMAAGKVIISSRVGGIPDLVQEGENGFLINPGDIDALAGYIARVATHPEEMTRIAANNRRKIEAEYDLPKLNAWLFALYRRLVNNHNPQTDTAPDGGYQHPQ